MKWLDPNGATQHSADHRYVVVQATSEQWIAYDIAGFGMGKELGVRSDPEKARQVCEDWDRELNALRKSG